MPFRLFCPCEHCKNAAYNKHLSSCIQAFGFAMILIRFIPGLSTAIPHKYRQSKKDRRQKSAVFLVPAVGLQPARKRPRAMQFKGVFLFANIFPSQFTFIEICHNRLISLNITLGCVGINSVHRRGFRFCFEPCADTRSFRFGQPLRKHE